MIGLVECVTPLNTAVQKYVGNITPDNQHSGYWFLPAISMLGAFRRAINLPCNAQYRITDALINAGQFTSYDARIFALPAPEPDMSDVLFTCPMVLKRFIRGFSSLSQGGTQRATYSHNDEIDAWLSEHTDRLAEYDCLGLSNDLFDALDWCQQFSRYGDKVWTLHLSEVSALFMVSDVKFSQLYQACLNIHTKASTTQDRIVQRTGTYQALPAGTLLYWPVFITTPTDCTHPVSDMLTDWKSLAGANDTLKLHIGARTRNGNGQCNLCWLSPVSP